VTIQSYSAGVVVAEFFLALLSSASSSSSCTLSSSCNAASSMGRYSAPLFPQAKRPRQRNTTKNRRYELMLTVTLAAGFTMGSQLRLWPEAQSHELLDKISKKALSWYSVYLSKVRSTISRLVKRHTQHRFTGHTTSI